MATESTFLNPRLTATTIDLYWVKRSILKAIEKALPNFKGTLLDVGCGQQPYRTLITSPPSEVEHYIGLDLAGQTYGGADKIAPDLRWDGIHIPLDSERIDTAFATEVLEHCPEPSIILAEIHRVLKPGGHFFFTVPFLWPLHDQPHDYYRYTPFALERLLSAAGFVDVKLEPLGGWDAALGQMLGLWVKRRPISSSYCTGMRKLLAFAALPFLRILYSKSSSSPTFASNPMITGVSGWAVK